MKKAKNVYSYKRLTNEQLRQVSDLYGIPLLSYLPKRSTEIYGAQYGSPSGTNMAGGSQWKHLEFTSALKPITFLSWTTIQSH